MVSDRLSPFGITIFSEMSKLAQERGAINLSQGFPDFDGPSEMLNAAVRSIKDGHNQYARSMGDPALVEAIVEKVYRHYQLNYDPYTEVVVFCGATEGILSAFLGLLNPGDEVIFFEPYYDSYPVCAALAGAVPRFYTLRFPDFVIDIEELERCFSSKTRLLLINTPHNPTGKVFSREELLGIAELCRKHHVIVLTDEVYEHLTYDGVKHIPMATLPEMREKTLTISSMGKTFSLTGWRVGWATGPEHLTSAVQSAHQYMTFAAATPFQIALATVLRKEGVDYYRKLRDEYTERRNILLDVLKKTGFRVAKPVGTYYILADFTGIRQGDDRSFVKYLIERCSVAAIPPSVFYSNCPEEGRRLVRFAFCKQIETLQKAAENLQLL